MNYSGRSNYSYMPQYMGSGSQMRDQYSQMDQSPYLPWQMAAITESGGRQSYQNGSQWSMQPSAYDHNPQKAYGYKANPYSDMQGSGQNYGSNGRFMGHSMVPFGAAVPCDETPYMF